MARDRAGAAPSGMLAANLATPVLIAPGWPRERHFNGIISYTDEIVEGMRRLGASPRISAFEVAQGFADPCVSEVPSPLADQGRAARLASKMFMRIAPNAAKLRLRADALLAALRRLELEAGANICEIEEAHGTVKYFARRSPVPVVVRLHGPWFLNGAALGVRQDRAFFRRVRLEGDGIALARAVSAPSRSVLEAVREHYDLPLESAEVIPNPVAPTDASNRWNAKACDSDRILFVGRFDRHKGGDVMLDAMRHVRRARPTCRLVFAGVDAGVETESGRRLQLSEYLRRRGYGAPAEAGVQWVGIQRPESLIALRREAAVTVICSRYENFPMAVLEAMALGCPIVATDTGGIPEMIQPDRNGLLCRPGDAEDLARKILVLLDNPACAAELGARSAADAELRYHPDKIARETLDFYGRVLERIAYEKRAR